MGRALVNTIYYFGSDFCYFFTRFLYCLVSSKFRRANHVEAFQRFFVAFIGGVLRYFRGRSQFFVLFAPADVHAYITGQACQVCLCRWHVVIAVNLSEGSIGRVTTLFTFHPGAILYSTRGDCFSNFCHFVVDLFVRRTRRRSFAYFIILCSDQGRSIRLVRVRFRFVLDSWFACSLVVYGCPVAGPSPRPGGLFLRHGGCLVMVPSPRECSFGSKVFVSPG